MKWMIVLAAPALWAQGTSTMHGTVSDRSAAVAPGAMLTVTNTPTGITRSTQSSQTGSFVFSQLPAGAYELKTEAQGFKSYLERNFLRQPAGDRRPPVHHEDGSPVDQPPPVERAVPAQRQPVPGRSIART
jgi:hypothetical protein